MRRLATVFVIIPLLVIGAAPAASDAPTTTDELLSGMVNEEIEPGVYRHGSSGTSRPYAQLAWARSVRSSVDLPERQQGALADAGPHSPGRR